MTLDRSQAGESPLATQEVAGVPESSQFIATMRNQIQHVLEGQQHQRVHGQPPFSLSDHGDLLLNPTTITRIGEPYIEGGFSGKEVVDVGSGFGRDVLHALARGARRVDSYDPSTEVLSLQSEWKSRLNIPGNLVTHQEGLPGLIESLPLHDVFICNTSLVFLGWEASPGESLAIARGHILNIQRKTRCGGAHIIRAFTEQSRFSRDGKPRKGFFPTDDELRQLWPVPQWMMQQFISESENHVIPTGQMISSSLVAVKVSDE